MRNSVSLVENTSVLRPPLHESGNVANYTNKQLQQYDFVPDERMESEQWLTGKKSTHYIPRSISSEFLNPQGRTTWVTKASMPNDEPDPTTEFLLEVVCRQNLVLNEGSDTVRIHSGRTLWPPSSIEALFELLDKLEFAGLDITTGFSSINESTPPPIEVQVSTQLENKLELLFFAAREEQFEVGMESQLARSLQELYTHNPNVVLQSLKARLADSKANPEVLAKILEWASHQESIILDDEIVALLSASLCNTSPLVRDAAALGLAYFNEDIAVGYLKQAIEKEEVPELRKDLEELLQSLEM